MEAVAEDQYLADPVAELDAANRAVRLANASGSRHYETCREAAANAARALRLDNPDLAVRFAQHAVAVAEATAVEGADPDAVWTEPGAEEAEVAVVEADHKRDAAEARMCEEDPERKASRGRYTKGCKCEACTAANTAYFNQRKAQGK